MITSLQLVATMSLLGSNLVAPTVAADGSKFGAEVRPVLSQRCIECHGGDEPKGDLALDRLVGDAEHERAAWRAVRRRVNEGSMPPKQKPRLADADRTALVGWIDAAIGTEPAPEPGRPVLRRLNRSEYANSIRDLFGVAIDANVELPADDVGFGFDTIGDVLSASDVHLDRWLAIAERVSARAVITEDPAHPAEERVIGKDLSKPNGTAGHKNARSLYTNAETGFDHKFPRDGEYNLRVRLWGDQAGDEPCRAALKVDGHELGRFDVPAREAAPQEIASRFHARAGTSKVRVAFLNDYYKPDDPDPKNRDRNLIVEWVAVEGPLDAPQLSRFQRDELDPATRGSLKDVVQRILRRTWRRPPTKDEVERVSALAMHENGFDDGVRTAIQAALVSPNFVYRFESDPEPGRVRDLSDHELATRLSYCLWSSCPDTELEAFADAGKLRANLRDEVRRMLRDPRAEALSHDFAAQWLQLRTLDRVVPDAKRFPDFDDELRDAMRAETELFFDAILREGRTVRELVDADFTFVNEKLATHYGIVGVKGSAMRRVRLERGARRGILGQASILTVTSNPTRTSPVKRGKFVLDNLLGAPTPPPPPGVGNLDERPKVVSAASLRERMEQHRRDPACAACHARLDPIGFALENFDATGGWRASDEGFPIDTRGEMPNGRRFGGAEELRAILLEGLDFTRTVTKKFAIYSLGRGLTASDESAIDDLVERLGPDATLAQLVEGVCTLDAFTKRSGPEVLK